MFDSHVSGSHAILGLFDTVHFRPTDRPTDRPTNRFALTIQCERLLARPRRITLRAIAAMPSFGARNRGRRALVARSLLTRVDPVHDFGHASDASCTGRSGPRGRAASAAAATKCNHAPGPLPGYRHPLKWALPGGLHQFTARFQCGFDRNACCPQVGHQSGALLGLFTSSNAEFTARSHGTAFA